VEDWKEPFTELVRPIKVISDPKETRTVSRDKYWLNPTLKEEFKVKFADLVALPQNVEDVVKILKTAYSLGVPVTVRGGGTGLRGQCIPMEGGIILNMKNLNKELEFDSFSGIMRCQSGRTLMVMDEAARTLGWELRLFPPTLTHATIGGYVASGKFGVGSLKCGSITDYGNVLSVTVVTMEEEPRVLSITEPDQVAGILSSCGTNCVIADVEIPLAPSQNWMELVVAFENIEDALPFAYGLGDCPTVDTKSLSFFQYPISATIPTIKETLPEKHHVIIALVAYSSHRQAIHLAREFKGKPISTEQLQVTKLTDYSWNHSLKNYFFLNGDAGWANAEFLYPPGFGNTMECITQCPHVLSHIEFVRTMKGQFAAVGLGIFKTSNLPEIETFFSEKGVQISFPEDYKMDKEHISNLAAVCKLKSEWDPKSLLNPGKLVVEK